MAYGNIEIKGYSNAIIVADIMAKSSDIEITKIEFVQKGGFVCIHVTGSVGDVENAVQTGIERAGSFLVGYTVIPNPDESLDIITGKNSEPGPRSPSPRGPAPEKQQNTAEKKPKSVPKPDVESKVSHKNAPLVQKSENQQKSVQGKSDKTPIKSESPQQIIENAQKMMEKNIPAASGKNTDATAKKSNSPEQLKLSVPKKVRKYETCNFICGLCDDKDCPDRK